VRFETKSSVRSIAVSWRWTGETNILLAKFIRPFLIFLLHLGYFGPVLMGTLDSSFLFLPFGNDLLVVTLVARNHHGLPWYVLAAAVGSTIGVFVLHLVARKLGKEGIEKMAGAKRFDKLSKMIDKHGGKAVGLACIAPPPFPFTMVIAAAAALDFSRLRICVINFFTRGVRFAILGLLAIKYGRHILKMADSNAFRWSMFGFIVLCIAGSAFSIYEWLKNVRSGKKA
jgi:membrane protein YqaA with SNARE-associated domain